jgi:hypothetical protein
MKYDYSIVAMAVAPQTSQQPFLLRVLSTSAHLSSDSPETIEIHRCGEHFILHVKSLKDGGSRSYSGMPLPTAVTTLIGHHFLPLDAHYDLIIVKESTSAHLPNGFIVTQIRH